MSTIISFFQPDEMSRRNGLRLAALNGALAVFCIVSFMGSLFLMTVLSMWLMLLTGDPFTFIPFPYPLLLLLYVVLFILAWTWFARRLPKVNRLETYKTGFIGAMPLFGLSLLGYASVIWTLIFGDFEANVMLDAGVAIYTIISTLILMAAISCVIFITYIAPKEQE